MAEPALRRMTIQEFLEWDDGGNERQELIGGCVVAMAPPMPGHGLLASALAGEIRSALRGRAPCRVYSEAGVALPHRNDACYVPDLVVSCQPLRPDNRLIREPVLIVEILSPTTAATDRQVKVPDYRRIASVQEILLIDAESLFAEVHRRDGDRWVTELIVGGEAMITLASIPASLLMAESL